MKEGKSSATGYRGGEEMDEKQDNILWHFVDEYPKFRTLKKVSLNYECN
jgi:hypothetical protein